MRYRFALRLHRKIEVTGRTPDALHAFDDIVVVG